ncbi:MAG: hypothetical protein R3B06_12520 [Kofleriaceae bacterium]
MSAGTYVVADEPGPSGLRGLVVSPSVPLLAAMLCGGWLTWPWFIVNALALAGPTRRKEIVLALAAIAGTVVLALVALALVDAGVIATDTTARLAVLVLTGWKLGMAYTVSALQGRTFHLYRYYHGVVRNPRAVLIAGLLLRPVVMDLFDDRLWRIIVMWGV